MEVIVASVDIYAGGADVNLKKITYYRYSGGKLKKVQDLERLIKKKHSTQYDAIHYATEKAAFKLDSKGNLMYRMCLYLNEQLDIVHFNDALVFKKGKFVNSRKKNFAFIDEEKLYYYSKGINKVYKKPGSSKVAFKLKNKEKFYREGIYIKNKSTYYVKIKAKKTGKTGYIRDKKFNATGGVGCKHA